MRWFIPLGRRRGRRHEASGVADGRSGNQHGPAVTGDVVEHQAGQAAMTDRVAARSDRGLKRTGNQDAVLAQELPDGSILAAVADGVGGTGGGETASAEAVQALLAGALNGPADDPTAALELAFSRANRGVRDRAAKRPELEGMATTLVAALVRGDSAWVANVGDSRAYLFHQGRLQQLTQDHSWVAEQVRAGRLTEEEAEQSDLRSVITRAIGTADSVEPDTLGPVPLPAGSLLLLCSDGLHRVVSDAEIAAALESGTPGEMAERLIDMANRAGGPDNVSAVIVAGA